MFIQNKHCYILIIPGFGIVSHIVSTFSGKPIFGQCGPKYFINILKQTICRELRKINKQNTIGVSHCIQLLLKNKKNFFIFFILLLVKNTGASISTILVVFIYFLMMVKIFVLSYNPQITKAHITKLYKSKFTLN